MLLTLPFALVGGVAAAYLTGGVLSLGSLVGFITVLGIAGRNGIMLVSHYRHLETVGGIPFGRELVLRGAVERVAPILMTALAAGLGLLPLALSGNKPGYEVEYPMAVVILGGLYGGVFTPTEAAAAACGYAMLYGLIVGRGSFVRELLPTAMRAMNLTGIIMFLIGSVGVFQFLAANMYWPQKITDTIVGWGLTPLGFVFAYMGFLLILGMFVDGVAMNLLTVPVIFPVAFAMKIDPVALGIMLTLNIEMGVVTPPVGLNLFAVSGTSKIPLQEVVKGTLPFFIGDGLVLLGVIFFPELATWLPDLLVKDAFK